MKLTYMDVDANINEEIEVCSVTVATKYVDKLTDGEYLLLEASEGNFVQTWRSDAEQYCLEFHGSGIHFATQPEFVCKAEVQMAFGAFLIHGSASPEFQRLQVWVEVELYSEHRGDPDVLESQDPSSDQAKPIPSRTNPSTLIEVKAPQLSDSVAEAYQPWLFWLVNEGEAVSPEYTLVIIETEDAVLDVLAPDTGVLVKIFKGNGGKVVSGEVIAQIDTEAKPFAGGRSGEVIAQMESEAKAASDENCSDDRTLSTTGNHTNGHEFEEFVASTLRNAGWTTRLTKKTGDQGLDLLVFDERFRAAIQCKRYSSPVGNTAVQEVHAAADFVGATHAVVVTTSSFTTSACQLAEGLGVILLNENELVDLRSHLLFVAPRLTRRGIPSVFRDESSS